MEEIGITPPEKVNYCKFILFPNEIGIYFYTLNKIRYATFNLVSVNLQSSLFFM